MYTKYGFISIIVENENKKIDFNNCNFNNIHYLFEFLFDVQFLEDITT